MLDLAGKRAIVCGSTQGIGRACAEMLAELGAEIVLVARDETALRNAREALQRPRDQKHSYVVADFRAPSQVREAVQGALGNTGAVDILVNNTGGPPAGPILDATPEQFTDALTMHVLCNHVLTQAVVPGMRERRYGRIINVISTSVRQPIPGLGVSNTTRAAVAAWAKTLAGELGPLGITVNNVLPGYTSTARLDTLIQNRAGKQNETVAAVAETMRGDTPLRRFASPEEIAAAVAFLASPAASYITGVSLPVDGGRIAAL